MPCALAIAIGGGLHAFCPQTFSSFVGIKSKVSFFLLPGFGPWIGGWKFFEGGFGVLHDAITRRYIVEGVGDFLHNAVPNPLCP